jgi:hypothetical protein
MKGGLLVAETHPVQYRAPVYRWLQQRHGVPVTVAYGTDASLHRYRDREFGAMSRGMSTSRADTPLTSCRKWPTGAAAIQRGCRPEALDGCWMPCGPRAC